MAPTRRQFIKKAGLIGVSAPTFEQLISKTVSAQSAPEIKMVDTEVLSIAYEEHGPEDGFRYISSGFPYDARSFDGVPESLVNAGYQCFCLT